MKSEELNPNLVPRQTHLTPKVELQLLGIEKKWIYGDKGWSEKGKIPEPVDIPVDETKEETSRKWWQFWKK